MDLCWQSNFSAFQYSIIPLRLPQISCFTLSLICFPSDSDSFPNVVIGPLLQFSHPPRAGPILLTFLFFPLLPSFYWVLCGPIYSFPLVRFSWPLSAGVLHALLCLKMYPWCIRGERGTPCPLLLHHLVLASIGVLILKLFHSHGSYAQHLLNPTNRPITVSQRQWSC